MSQQSDEKFIKAAGGLVWRDVEEGRQLLLIHRERYDDWTLPKGKLEPGEGWRNAAQREVTEETGYAVILHELAGVTTYYHGRRPKVVLFWNMVVTGQPGDQAIDENGQTEVDRMLWVNVEQAMQRLSYQAEKELVAQNWAKKR